MTKRELVKKIREVIRIELKKEEINESTPLAPPHDFDKPTVVHISKDELITLYKTGTLETDGLTIIYGD
ncbi:hypothetical protein HOE22_07600 [Candidatus Woesearchaeota archaeon]|jgi:hypothetical protein|nr:hypothetical protein [Candidatus Woesearchaeota archaeon]